MKSHFASVAAAVLLGTTPLVPIQTTPAAAQTASAQAELQTVTFGVENMTCATCPITVRLAMEAVEGVRSVEIDFETKTATVVFDPAIASPAAIGAASTNAGYPAAVRS
jgi:mercuric ion binding protein